MNIKWFFFVPKTIDAYVLLFWLRGAGWSASIAAGKANSWRLGSISKVTVGCGGSNQWTVVCRGSVVSGSVSDATRVAWSIVRSSHISRVADLCAATTRPLRCCWADSLLNCRCLKRSQPVLSSFGVILLLLLLLLLRLLAFLLW